VQDADAGRSEHLVAGERVPVGVEVLHVDAHVRDRLGAVDQHPRAVTMRDLDHVSRRSDCPEDIRDV
jgi:hypothetical protein